METAEGICHHTTTHNNTQHTSRRDRDTETERQNPSITNDLHVRNCRWCSVKRSLWPSTMVSFFFLQTFLMIIFMLSWIVKDATTFEMEMCGYKQATAHAHVRPQKCVVELWTRKSKSNLLINSKKPEIVRIGFWAHGNLQEDAHVYRRTSTGNAFLFAAASSTWTHGARLRLETQNKIVSHERYLQGFERRV